jgi:hypothetical protein
MPGFAMKNRQLPITSHRELNGNFFPDNYQTNVNSIKTIESGKGMLSMLNGTDHREKVTGNCLLIKSSRNVIFYEGFGQKASQVVHYGNNIGAESVGTKKS